MGTVRGRCGNYLGAHNLVGQMVKEAAKVKVLIAVPMTKEVSREARHAHPRRLLKIFKRILNLNFHHAVHQRLDSLFHFGKRLSNLFKDSAHAWQIELEAGTTLESGVTFIKDFNVFINLWLLHLRKDLLHGGHLLHPRHSLFHPGNDVLHPGEQLWKAESYDGGSTRVLFGHHICLGRRGGHDWRHSLWGCVEALGTEHDGSWSSENVQKAGNICSWDRGPGSLGHPWGSRCLRLNAGSGCFLPCLGRFLWSEHCGSRGTLCPYKSWATSPWECGRWGRGPSGKYGCRGRRPLSGELAAPLRWDIAVKVEPTARLAGRQKSSFKSLVAAWDEMFKFSAGRMGIVTHFGCSSGGFRGCPGTHSSPQSSQRTGSLLGMHPGKVGPKSWGHFLSSYSHPPTKIFWKCQMAAAPRKLHLKWLKQANVATIPRWQSGQLNRSFCHRNGKSQLGLSLDLMSKHCISLQPAVNLLGEGSFAWQLLHLTFEKPPQSLHWASEVARCIYLYNAEKVHVKLLSHENYIAHSISSTLDCDALI